MDHSEPSSVSRLRELVSQANPNLVEVAATGILVSELGAKQCPSALLLDAAELLTQRTTPPPAAFKLVETAAHDIPYRDPLEPRSQQIWSALLAKLAPAERFTRAMEVLQTYQYDRTLVEQACTAIIKHIYSQNDAVTRLDAALFVLRGLSSNPETRSGALQVIQDNIPALSSPPEKKKYAFEMRRYSPVGSTFNAVACQILGVEPSRGWDDPSPKTPGLPKPEV
jgi:hypothetical protein